MQTTSLIGVDVIAIDANASNTQNSNRQALTTTMKAVPGAAGAAAITATDDTTTASILDFLNQEQKCMDNGNDSDFDVDSIFEEINRLSGGDSEDRSVDDLLREAELLLSKQENLVDIDNKMGELLKTISEESTPREMKLGAEIDQLESYQVNTGYHFNNICQKEAAQFLYIINKIIIQVQCHMYDVFFLII